MNYKLDVLPNKLRVAAVSMPSSESLTVTVWVKAGSRQENAPAFGLAHFLEHMAFKGSKKFRSTKEISEIVDGMGAVDNAGTSKEWTNFWIKVEKSNLDRAMEILGDIVVNPLLDPTEINKERGVINDEIAMYEDTPMMDIGEFFEENIYKETDLGRRIAGNRESLEKVNREKFIEFRSKFYHPENMLISVAGGTDEKTVIELAKKYFSEISGGPTQGNPRVGPFTGSDVVRGVGGGSDPGTLRVRHHPEVIKPLNRFTLKTKKSDQAHLILGFPGPGRGYKGRFALGVLSTILGGGMSSRLWLEVRGARGLAYAVRAVSEKYSDSGYLGAYSGVRLDAAEEALKVIMEEIEDLKNKKKPIDKKELEKAKNNLKGHFALSLEDTSEVGDFFAEQILFDKDVLTPKDIMEGIAKVTVEDVYREADKIFDFKKLHLSIIGPFEGSDKFHKLLK